MGSINLMKKQYNPAQSHWTYMYGTHYDQVRVLTCNLVVTQDQSSDVVESNWKRVVRNSFEKRNHV